MGVNNGGWRSQDVGPQVESDSFQRFYDAYNSARFLTLGGPTQDQEIESFSKTESVLRQLLRNSKQSAHVNALKNRFFQRDHLLHEAFAVHLPSSGIGKLVSTVSLESIPDFSDKDQSRGVLFISLHYGPYSSLLVWKLAQVVINYSSMNLSVLMRTTSTGQYCLPDERLRDYEQSGVWSMERVSLVDRSTAGPAGVLAALRRKLAGAEAVLILPDAVIASPSTTTVNVSVGRRRIGLAGGIRWLAQHTGCVVVPVFIRPSLGSAHTLVFGPPTVSSAGDLIEDSAQFLIDNAVLSEPAGWFGWARAADALLQ